jgi:two-component system cell cycle response regulator
MGIPARAASVDESIIDDRRKSASNRRSSPRTRTLKGAQIIWDDSKSPVRCTIRNISKTGAKLEAHGLVVKNIFELVFDLDQSRRSCRVIWRKEPLIGVKFV